MRGRSPSLAPVGARVREEKPAEALSEQGEISSPVSNSSSTALLRWLKLKGLGSGLRHDSSGLVNSIVDIFFFSCIRLVKTCSVFFLSYFLPASLIRNLLVLIG